MSFIVPETPVHKRPFGKKRESEDEDSGDDALAGGHTTGMPVRKIK